MGNSRRAPPKHVIAKLAEVAAPGQADRAPLSASKGIPGSAAGPRPPLTSAVSASS